jgi:hypothetical protein
MSKNYEAELYRAKEVLEITGWKRSKLDQWLNRGLITPEVVSTRKGIPSGFSIENIVQLVITERLANCGIDIRTASEIAREIIGVVDDCGGVDELDSYDQLWVEVNLENTSERNYYPDPPTAQWPVALAIKFDDIYLDVLDRLGDL